MSDPNDPRYRGDPDHRADRPDEDTPTEAFDPRANADPSDPPGSTGASGSPERGAGDSGAPTERFDVTRDGADGGVDTATRRMPQQPGLRYPDDADATRRMPNPGNDAPTERFGATPSWQPSPRDIPVYEAAAAPPRNGPPAPPKKTSNGGRIALIIIGVLLVVALAVLALVFFAPQNPTTDASSSPSVSETPSSTPSETPTPTPEPEPEPEPEPAPAPAATFVSFSPADNTEIACPDEETEAPLTFSWTSSDATRAWIAAGETDARANPDAEVDPSGTYRDLVFDCSQDTEIYTISLENEEGELTSQSVTLRRALDE